ncbi:serine carboxypeptidase-like [Musa troglodytarum]|uniref:Serine carboxypeptidase-like n=1 Tax=Musa troglodytarum TaxID=320322 RepID=A0A9E7JJ72_9LILI|nr:serine carboxypeptidase-like [Musa troglodytarum]
MAAAAVRELLLSFSSAALLLLLLFLAQQPPVSSLNVITHLPGFEGPLPFHLETGYVDVDEANGVQLFYYFIRSERKPADDPLMVWITGGPGCSAFSGLMYEIGPLQFDVAGYTFGLLPSLIYNPISWTKVSSIIFLDSPVGTGFSYSSTEQGSLITDTKSAIHVCTFLKKWYVDHPSFIKNPLYIGGDSYSGLLVPIIAQYISDGNEAGDGWHFNLKGYLVGNPSTDGEYDGNAIIPYVHGMGLISDELYEATKRSCGGQYQSPGNAECASCLQAVSQGLFGINNVHILEPLCFFASPKRNILTADRRKLLEEHLEQPLSKSDLPLQCRVNPFLFLKPKLHFRLLLLEKKNPCVISGEPSYQSSGYVLSYFWANNDTVREALGVREGTKQMWVRCNYGINYTNDVPSSLKYHLSLTSRGYRALAYSGDHDMSVPFVGTQAWIRSLNFSIVDDWRSWFVDGQVAGFTRSYSNNLTFVTIKGAGHTAPEYKPKECLAMVDRWFAGSPL